MAIREKFLYGLIQLETAAWGATFTWVDRTATLVNGVNYSEGGRIGPPGQSQVDVGTFNATFKDAATVPAVGDLVRLRRYGTTEYFFTGYVQDVSQRIVFDNTVKLNSPIVLTTINCADWVGLLGQFQAVGAGGVQTDGTVITTSYYAWPSRVEALNKAIDATMATDLISYSGTGSGLIYLGDTDLVGSLADHLDLVARTISSLYWYGTHTLPTDNTTGRDSLVFMTAATPTASGYTFRDDLGSGSNQLHYTEIDFENTTQNVSNSLVLSNRARLDIADTDITRIGGFNEANYMVVADTNITGVPVDIVQKRTNATSITTYGVRQTEFDINAGVSTSVVYNLLANPSAEYSDDGYSGTANQKVRRYKPSLDANPFTAYTGLWAIRSRVLSTSGSAVIFFTGGESDGTPVTPATTYYFNAQALRGTVSQTNTRAYARIVWYDDEEVELSRVEGTKVNLTTANTWYQVAVSGAAPAGANRATVAVVHERVSGSLQRTDRLWADALYFSKTNTTYFDGDVATTVDYVYGWCGGVGSSPSFKLVNYVDDMADVFLAAYATTSMRASRIRWNAQEDLTAVSSLTVGKSISLVYGGATNTYRIVGIDGTVDPSRYMIDYYLIKI